MKSIEEFITLIKSITERKKIDMIAVILLSSEVFVEIIYQF